MEIALFWVGVFLILFGGIALIVWCLMNIDPNPLILVPVFMVLVGSLCMTTTIKKIEGERETTSVTEVTYQEIVIDNKRYVLAEDVIVIDGNTYVLVEDMNTTETTIEVE